MFYDARDSAWLRRGVLLASLIAWILLLAGPHESCHAAAPPKGLASGPGCGCPTLTSFFGGWALMLVAMMAPMTLPALYYIRISSFAKRRLRSSSLFLLGYGLVWMTAGGILRVMELAARVLSLQPYLPALAVGLIACLWQASPLKQRCLNRCHRHRTLAAFGLSADGDALRMGLDHGLWCVGSCWAMMLFPMLLPKGHLLAMAVVAVVMICERLDPPRPLSWRLRGFHTAWRVVRMRVWGPPDTPPPIGAAALESGAGGSPL